jgi:hypothetical protein
LVVHDALAQPVAGSDFPDLRNFGYGISIPWMIFPLSALALLWAIGRSVWRFRSPPARSARNLIVCILPLLITAPFSPALWSARYNLHVVAALIFLVSAFTALPSLRRLAEGIVAAAGLSALMQAAWADPGWSVDFAQACQLAKMSSRERASALVIHWGADPDAALARENEIGPNDTVVVTDDFRFPSVLWNERFSNRVVYVRSYPAPAFLTGLDQEHAKWVAVMDGSGAYRAVHGRPDTWQRVGALAVNLPQIVAFRRIGP